MLTNPGRACSTHPAIDGSRLVDLDTPVTANRRVSCRVFLAPLGLSIHGLALAVAASLLGGSSLVPACGGEATDRRAPASSDAIGDADDGGGGDSGAGDHVRSRDAQADGAAFTSHDQYRCCAPGEGTACCTGMKQGTCFRHGGIYGDCRKAGEEIEGKVICAECCPGLSRQGIYALEDKWPPAVDHLPEGCDLDAPVSLGICILCGDGVCGAGENFCNCPQDCPRALRDAGTDAG